MADRGRSVSRQSSASDLRRTAFSTCRVLRSPFCRLLLTMGVIFCAGVFFGLYLLPAVPALSSWRPARDVGGHASGETPPEEKGRPGLSIKKDLSIQFRDYLPHRIFVDSLLSGPPRSLELFLETHPDAHKYALFAFLGDTSYRPLYDKFPNITLYPGTVLSNVQKTTTIQFPSREGVGKRSVPAVTVSLSAWLKDHVHPDDYVIVKLNTKPQLEERVVMDLAMSESVEWIDKFYTTSQETDLGGMAREGFHSRGQEVLLWDDDKHTYSDFEEINAPALNRNSSVEVSNCRLENGSYSAVLLYVSQVNSNSRAALSLLNTISRNSSLPLTVFLPLDYLDSPSLSHTLSSISRHVELGMYLRDALLSHLQSHTKEEHHNLLRNKLVSAEHCFARIGNLTLEYVLPEFAIQRPKDGRNQGKSLQEQEVALLRRVLSDRAYTILDNVTQLSPPHGEDSQGSVPAAEEVVGVDGGGLLAMDISLQGADAVVLQLLTRHLSSLMPMQVCVDRAKRDE